ncbi:HRDC domain-containing protein [Ferrimicrobium sp.]|uniref:HRDC domain-containing protein n=1 Tax=Ferrimicrobium sp. TaxID=2926050 RepID=UPI002617AFA4|nr:HRDC domain-containing protein [Ferrimicrobium sp.]
MRQAQALARLIKGDSVFLTGPPGAGKSYVLRQFVHLARRRGLTIAVTASTGIAATQIGGATIHSWSGIGIRDQLAPNDLANLSSKDRLVRRYLTTDALIIDEISMLSGNFLTMLDQLARTIRGTDAPFGGLQMVLVGDMFQLPPINRDSSEIDFAFQSAAWRDLDPLPCYLTEQHRQSGDELAEVLSAMRDGSLGQAHLAILNSRIGILPSDDHEPTHLYSHNVDVDAMNAQRLARIGGEVHTYTMELRGPPALVEPMRRGVLAPDELALKVGAEVMFVANDQNLRYANGSLARVVDLSGPWPIVELAATSRRMSVEPHAWVLEEDGSTKAEVRQLPLRLAWAITIHKSQGMSLDAAEIDLSRSFTPGMGYVALSRLRRLSGLYLKGLNTMALQLHPEIYDFDRELRRRSDRLAEETDDILVEEVDTDEAVSTVDATPLDLNLFALLKAWRREQARAEGVPAYVIAPDMTLADIATRTPQDSISLLRIKGMGTTRVARYGEAIIAVVQHSRNPPPTQDSLFG